MAHCPWDSLHPAPLNFCEEVLCSWIKQPSNTWSNIGFIFVGIWIWRVAKKERQTHLKWIGLISIIMGLGSALYHASGTCIGGISDYFGMLLSTSFLTAINTRRWLRCSFSIMYGICAITLAVLLFLLIELPGQERLLYALSGPCCLIELGLYFRDGKTIDYRNYLYGGALAGIGTFLWWLDTSKLWCDPKNHAISGHALWHILMAISIYFFYRYYTQFKVLSDKAVVP